MRFRVLLEKLFEIVKRCAAMAWVAPVSVPCFVFYILPCWKLGWYRLVGHEQHAWIFVHDRMPAWLERLWRPWSGQCVGNCVVLKYDPSLSSAAKVILKHELVHTQQVMKWGVLQPIAYALSSVTAWMAGEDSYSANHFEVAARRAAGQKVSNK